MTMRQRRSVTGVSLLVGLGLVILMGTALMGRATGAQGVIRIELIAQQMTFRQRDAADPSQWLDNPTLMVRTGETVELVLRNRDAGMKHDLTIAELGLKTRMTYFGDTVVLRFTAPQPGTYIYLCSIHPRLMRGRLIVESRS
ncbi:MAG: cupredoxin domain-containing protein [Planctomycetota bacterium]|nr:cupredoxin domain-containing protein [Planctomycetota bacterium]MCZ6851519.1 cupredoxin domain-containing protein [Planctomycetota bacterium]